MCHLLLSQQQWKSNQSQPQQQSSDRKLGDEQISNEVCKLMKQVKYFTLHRHFFWAVWSLLQAAHSSINFDFVGYALDRLKEYEKSKCQLLRAPGNGHLIEEREAQAWLSNTHQIESNNFKCNTWDALNPHQLKVDLHGFYLYLWD